MIYNYENDSWALFDDSLTAIGNFQTTNSRTWLSTEIPWIDCDFSWIESQPQETPVIAATNQQGFAGILDQNVTNDPSLLIKGITGGASALVITSPNHNLSTGTVIGISGILGTAFTSLNDLVFAVSVIDENTFNLLTYNATSDDFSDFVYKDSATYIGGGVIEVRDNFSVISKKFNFLDQGQSIQMGYIDILMQSTESSDPGAISLNVYLDYNMDEASNTYPANQQNVYPPVAAPDTFFNTIIPTVSSSLNSIGGTKFWQRVFCPTRGNFLTLQYTFNNAQMAGNEQTLDVQIDAQVLWLRPAGRMTQI